MTPDERGNTFIYGVLTECCAILQHAVGLAGGTSGLRLIHNAVVAVNRARCHYEDAVDAATDWEKDKTEGDAE